MIPTYRELDERLADILRRLDELDRQLAEWLASLGKSA